MRFSLAMDDMRRLVDQVGFAEHEDSDMDEETETARRRAAAAGGNRKGARRVVDEVRRCVVYIQCVCSIYVL